MPCIRQPSQASRRGIASLELVMSFPILMILVAMLYTVYMASIMKSQLTMEVRHVSWLERTAPPKNNSFPFGIPKAHSSGESQAKPLTRKVKVYSNFQYISKTIPREITWGNRVLTGSWDYRQVEFDDGFVIYPHFGVLTQMVSAQGGVNSGGGNVSSLSGLTSFPGL